MNCEWCGKPLPPPARPGGRQRRFCNDAHRAAWNRQHSQTTSPQTAALPVIPAGGPADPVTWKPRPAAVRDLPPPEPCPVCGRDRMWTPHATSAVCSEHGLSLQVAVSGQSDVPDRRIPTPEDDLLTALELGRQIGELDELVDELLHRDDLSGGGRGWLRTFRKRLRAATSPEQVVRLRVLLNETLGASRDDDPEVVDGEIVSDSWDDEDGLAIEAGQDPAVLAGGMVLSSIDVPAGRLFGTGLVPGPVAEQAAGSRNPAAEFRARLAADKAGGPAERAPRRAVRPEPPGPPTVLRPVTGADVALWRSAAADAANRQQQQLIRRWLDSGQTHEAVAAAVGGRPEYPRQVEARRRGLLPIGWKRK